MAYDKFHDPWVDFPATATPLTAEALNHFEDALEALDAAPGGDVEWPAGGSDGQVLTLVDGDPAWSAPEVEWPAGGTDGQVLALTDGDPAWESLGKGSVGLGNVDNTSDVNKPISAATASALDTLSGVVSTKADASAVTEALAGKASTAAATTGAAGLVELATTGEAETGTDTTRAVTPAGVKAVADTKAADNAVVKLTGAQTVAGVKTFSDPPVVPDASLGIAKVSGLAAALDLRIPAIILEEAEAADPGTYLDGHPVPTIVYIIPNGARTW